MPQFDPGVFREGDRTYLYTGFCMPDDLSRHGATVTVLGPDMLTVIEAPRFVLPSKPYSAGTGFEGHEYCEAPERQAVPARIGVRRPFRPVGDASDRARLVSPTCAASSSRPRGPAGGSRAGHIVGWAECKTVGRRVGSKHKTTLVRLALGAPQPVGQPSTSISLAMQPCPKTAIGGAIHKPASRSPDRAAHLG